jgi:DNA-binding PadR family transcriptional regulator
MPHERQGNDDRKRSDRLGRFQDIRPLDMFLLGLVRGRLITPYDWQARARVSLGASLPAVARLLRSGLLKKSRLGPRGRHEFALTPKGDRQVDELDGYLDRIFESPIGEVETVIRLACLATVVGRTRLAKDILLDASAEHDRRSRAAKKKTRDSVPFKSRLGGLYSRVLSRCDAAQEAAIAEELEALSRGWNAIADEILESWQGEK